MPTRVRSALRETNDLLCTRRRVSIARVQYRPSCGPPPHVLADYTREITNQQKKKRERMIKKDALLHYSDVCITSPAAKSGDRPRATPPPHRRTPKEGAPGSLKEEQKEEEEEEEEDGRGRHPDGTQTAPRRHLSNLCHEKRRPSVLLLVLALVHVDEEDRAGDEERRREHPHHHLDDLVHAGGNKKK